MGGKFGWRVELMCKFPAKQYSGDQDWCSEQVAGKMGTSEEVNCFFIFSTIPACETSTVTYLFPNGINLFRLQEFLIKNVNNSCDGMHLTVCLAENQLCAGPFWKGTQMGYLGRYTSDFKRSVDFSPTQKSQEQLLPFYSLDTASMDKKNLVSPAVTTERDL